MQEESDADTPKAATPKSIVVSGGLTGFGIAKDLLQIDFSTPEEAPEEYRAVAFYEEPRSLKPGGPSGAFNLKYSMPHRCHTEKVMIGYLDDCRSCLGSSAACM